MKSIKDHMLVLCIVCSVVLLSLVGYGGRNGRYAAYREQDGLWTPAAAYVLQGIADGVYPWSPVEAESPGLLNYEETELAEAVVEEMPSEKTPVAVSEGETKAEEEKETAIPENEEAAETEETTEQEESLEIQESEEIEESEASEEPEQDSKIEETEETEETKLIVSDPDKPYTIFTNALFIGDSRTVGMQAYGGLDEDVEFYCVTSLSIYKLFQKPKSFARNLEGRKCTLEEALSERQFEHIFIMLGLNELGVGNTAYFIDAYEDALVRIRTLQPFAKIYVQGIMRVTGSKSRNDKTFRNEVVNERNVGLQELCSRMGIQYLEINDALCDENGDLCEEYSSDNVHLKAKYYALWVDYLRQNAIP